MGDFSPFATPRRTAFDPETGLHLPLKHLFGRKIAIHLERSCQLDISYWRFSSGSTLGKCYAGRIHIVPTHLDDYLTLIEDLPQQKLPEDFPVVSERTTSSKEVNVSLVYPLSWENWNIRIHYNYGGLPHPFRDNDCEFLIADGRLGRSMCHHVFEDLEKVVYDSPRTRPKILQPATAPQ